MSFNYSEQHFIKISQRESGKQHVSLFYSHGKWNEWIICAGAMFFPFFEEMIYGWYLRNLQRNECQRWIMYGAEQFFLILMPWNPKGNEKFDMIIFWKESMKLPLKLKNFLGIHFSYSSLGLRGKRVCSTFGITSDKSSGDLKWITTRAWKLGCEYRRTALNFAERSRKFKLQAWIK